MVTMLKNYVKGICCVSQLSFKDRLETWALLNPSTQICLTGFLLFAQVVFPGHTFCYLAKEAGPRTLLGKWPL